MLREVTRKVDTENDRTLTHTCTRVTPCTGAHQQAGYTNNQFLPEITGRRAKTVRDTEKEAHTHTHAHNYTHRQSQKEERKKRLSKTE